ncbi:MAG: hypothetical protein KY455_05115 [Euryarchaeota archaeon]|nr:hypothetical protein [Euryarchaeota archaeon]
MNRPFGRGGTIVVLWCLITFLVAGCADQDAGDEERRDEVERPSPAEGPARCLDCDTDSDLVPVESPDWSVGDWWEWRIQGGGYDFRVTTVVAGSEAGSTLIGIADRPSDLLAPWFHVPPVGRVDPSTLGYEAHDLDMRLLAFPLWDGKEWTGAIEGDPVTFVANRTDPDGPFTIEGEYDSGGTAVRLGYDPDARMLNEIALYYGGSSAWSEATLVAWGSDSEEPWVVPDLDDLFLGGAWLPRDPLETTTIAVADDVEHILFGCETGGSIGAHHAVLQGPDGGRTICPGEDAWTAAGRTTFVVAVPAQPGSWALSLTAAGDGYVSVEMAAMGFIPVV